MRKYCVAFLVILLAGCAGSHSAGRGDQTRNFSSSTEVRDALAGANLVCTDYKPLPSERREPGAHDAADYGYCNLANESINLIIWKDKGQKDNWVGITKNAGCQMGKALGISSFNYVDGGLWTVSNMSEGLANKVSGAIGGKPEHIACS